MSSTNGRCNSAERGSSHQRRARKAWLLSPAAGWGGDGGRYTRDNIAPHCPLCPSRQGQRRTMAILRAKRAAA